MCEETETPHRGVATRRLRALMAALLGGTRFLLCNCRHAQQFYRAKFLVGDCKVLVFNFSFEITAARLNLCDGPGLDLELDSFQCGQNLHFKLDFFWQRHPGNSYLKVWMILVCYLMF